ncbi:MAG: extensin family protein, partial [Myxococcales bacterium]|nr:extensin family protein [Myxococcales bacterium]
MVSLRPLSLVLLLGLSLAACDDDGTVPNSPPPLQVIQDGGGAGGAGGGGPLPFDQGEAVDRGRPDRDAGPDAEPIPDPRDAGVPMDQGRPPADMAPPTPDMDPPAPDMDPGLPPDPGLNAGWIGGPCAVDGDCDYDEAFCLQEAEGYPRGMCSLGCERVCPDQAGMPVTFCIGDVIVGSGACVQRCDVDAFGGDGCRPGYFCDVRGRYSEPGTQRGVCVPGQAPPPPQCLADLAALGVAFVPAEERNDMPDGLPGVTCDIPDPVRVSSPVNGISYRYVSHDAPQPIYMACPLAHALVELGALLQEYDIVEVGHIGVYNCRAISGTNSLSEHGYARAIDLKWFRTRDGQVYDVEDHWEHDTQNFRTEAGRILFELGQQMFERRIFNIVLTPNYNAAHD